MYFKHKNGFFLVVCLKTESADIQKKLLVVDWMTRYS